MYKFDPISLKPTIWYDTDYGVQSAVGVPAVSGTGVFRWLDKGGSGNHGYNNIASARPTYLGGRNGISGDGSNDTLNVTGSGQEIHEFLSIQRSIGGTFNNYWFPIANNGSTEPRLGTFGAFSSSLWADPLISHVRKNGTRINTFVDSSPELGVVSGDFLLDVLTPNPTSNTRTFSLISLENMYYGNANMKELIAFNRVLSHVERQQLNSYFASKYNLDIPISPETIPNLFLWLNADIVTGADGANVSGWHDSTANAFHFDQITGGNQPILKKNSMNGHSALRFNGTSTVLRRAKITPGTSFTTFVVARPRITSAESIAYACLYADNNLRLFNKLSTSSWGLYTSVGVDLAAGESLERYSPALIRITSNGSTSSIYRNGVLKNSIGAIPVGLTTTDSCVGAEMGVGRYFKGDISEILVFNRVLSDVEIEQVEKHLTHKYNIGMTLPSSIPNNRLWLDAEYLGLTNGATVTGWEDRSSVGAIVNQTGAAYQPTYATVGISDKPAINFNGSKMFNTNSFGPGGNFTLFWAAKGTDYTSLIRYQRHNGFIVFPWALTYAIDVNNGNAGTGGLAYSYTNVPTVACYASEQNNALGRTLSVNGNYITGKSTAGGAINDELVIGAYHPAGGTPQEFTNAHVGDVIIYNRRLEPYEQKFVEDYLKCKYNT